MFERLELELEGAGRVRAFLTRPAEAGGPVPGDPVRPLPRRAARDRRQRADGRTLLPAEPLRPPPRTSRVRDAVHGHADVRGPGRCRGERRRDGAHLVRQVAHRADGVGAGRGPDLSCCRATTWIAGASAAFGISLGSTLAVLARGPRPQDHRRRAPLLLRRLRDPRRAGRPRQPRHLPARSGAPASTRRPGRSPASSRRARSSSAWARTTSSPRLRASSARSPSRGRCTRRPGPRMPSRCSCSPASTIGRRPRCIDRVMAFFERELRPGHPAEP